MDLTPTIETIDGLANILYECGCSNMAERLARCHGKADALTFLPLMDENVQNFWRGIAKQLIEHSRHWQPNDGCCYVLDAEESKRLAELPRVKGD